MIFSVGTECDYGGNKCCSYTNQCPENQGDCDSDNDCQLGLKCGTNNCPKDWKWIDVVDDDCCYDPVDGGSGGM